jgi:hypothetical protein
MIFLTKQYSNAWKNSTIIDFFKANLIFYLS